MNGTTRGEIVDEASNWLVGGGIVTMALAPLALPGIALLLVAAIPAVGPGPRRRTPRSGRDRADCARARPDEADRRVEAPEASPGRIRAR